MTNCLSSNYPYRYQFTNGRLDTFLDSEELWQRSGQYPMWSSDMKLDTTWTDKGRFVPWPITGPPFKTR